MAAEQTDCCYQPGATVDRSNPTSPVLILRCLPPVLIAHTFQPSSTWPASPSVEVSCSCSCTRLRVTR